MNTIYRNQKLLDLAKQAPHCMNIACMAPNSGQVVGCHSNMIKHGKGKSIKAHDIPAYGCNVCHDKIDGRGGYNLPRAEAQLLFYEMQYMSLLWLLQSGHLKVSK
jgi:hypothetical protein